METLVEEVRLWNTPAVGAYLLWKFTQGYIGNHVSSDAPLSLLHFIAMPILLSRKLSDPISNRRPNLQSYIKSFEDSKTSDLLLSIQDKIIERRMYTLSAIDLCISKGLLFWDYESGKIYSKDVDVRKNRVGPILDKEGNRAYILGKWFSQHNLSSIINYFKLVL